jgi:hypothetical protein
MFQILLASDTSAGTNLNRQSEQEYLFRVGMGFNPALCPYSCYFVRFQLPATPGAKDDGD